jgi:hypothetical protein
LKTRQAGWAVMLALVTLLVGSAPAAMASPPAIQTLTIDQTQYAGRAAATCGFDVWVHREGTIRIITRYDENGNPIRELDLFRVNDTFTANGLGITGLERSVTNITYNSDGSMLVVFAGPDRWVVQPGGGPIWGTTGGVISYMSPEGEWTTLHMGGVDQDFNPALCAALTP